MTTETYVVWENRKKK